MKTAEAVSLGHPDKTADYISSYILDRCVEQDSAVRYGVEVMVKNQTIVLGGEVSGNVSLEAVEDYVRQAVREIGYDERYADLWKDEALNINKLKIVNLISCQSAQIAQGVARDGWGDQGIFVGYACQGTDNMPAELFWSRRLCRCLYEKALNSDNLGLDIKTQITMDGDKIKTAVVAVPMRQKEDLSDFIGRVLPQQPEKLIVNGTGAYTCHSSVADCGVTGRKLACDFYSAASPVGGGSPWTKDASKADLTLNLYARRLALENLADNDEVWVYLSSCIGHSELLSAVLKTRKGDKLSECALTEESRPSVLIKKLGLDKPVFAGFCRSGLF
ncbi:MAG: methionine adenosyltransferase domain-containing protein [Pseudomonadota bacterium]|nr:methionine adenosyltransferase domain-containing protein [Pseudomonadota bacterium]